ncbi:hypothetical protein GCM10010413_31410 [Promicromonospora sukumoe]|uniref:Small multidrug efflux protein n=1 Tax=Promicromonospora sukumoe TaxID=88382 RepID=A0A7W3J849_9MICO|nr:small multidrug efflux protein [Promicromonospora sukumoe]MBA8807894.1 hypothetical protein [Promicromonospora sukumoe]
MNPVEQLVSNFQEFVGQVPEIIRPLVVMLAGAVPFLEGEVASMIGVLGGLNPVVAGLAAAAGNFLCVFVVVVLTSRARVAVTGYRARTAEAGAETQEPAPAKPESKGRLRFKKWLVRFGVPGASILGPLAIPTQFTSAILVAGGTPRAWVLLWQAVAIVLWTTLATVSTTLALHFVIPG